MFQLTHDLTTRRVYGDLRLTTSFDGEHPVVLVESPHSESESYPVGPDLWLRVGEDIENSRSYVNAAAVNAGVRRDIAYLASDALAMTKVQLQGHYRITEDQS
jgi:hypothetical protein